MVHHIIVSRESNAVVETCDSRLLLGMHQLEIRLFCGELQARWATPDLVIAQRRLLKVALQEPRNARFLMASDSCVPLYPPAAVHAALLGEPRSRVAACRPTWEDNFPVSARQRALIERTGLIPCTLLATFGELCLHCCRVMSSSRSPLCVI